MLRLPLLALTWLVATAIGVLLGLVGVRLVVSEVTEIRAAAPLSRPEVLEALRGGGKPAGGQALVPTLHSAPSSHSDLPRPSSPFRPSSPWPGSPGDSPAAGDSPPAAAGGVAGGPPPQAPAAGAPARPEARSDTTAPPPSTTATSSAGERSEGESPQQVLDRGGNEGAEVGDGRGGEEGE